MERGHLKYVCVGLACGILLTMMTLHLDPIQGAATSLGTRLQHGSPKYRDDNAHPVFSVQSELSQKLKGMSGLPDVLELDYKSVEVKDDVYFVEKQDAFVALTLQRQVVCTNWAMYGAGEGTWPVCKAKALIPTLPCLVYSFGIKNDWSFDDDYRKAHGCIIRTFDPSMGETKEHQHSPGVFFYPLGLSDKKRKNRKGWNMNTYEGFLERFGEENKTISYLKFDIDGDDFVVLDNMLASGLLKNVMQLSLEIHMSGQEKYFKLLKQLEHLGFRRWFYHHRLNGFPLQVDNAYININYLK